MDANDILTTLGKQFRAPRVDYAAESLEVLNLSWSLAGEDVVLRKRLKDKFNSGEPGTYVDIGAFHPWLASNTYLFYGAGWSGLCVDANPVFGDMFAAVRPRDTYIHAAVLDRPGHVYFAEHRENTGMSGVFSDPSDVPVEYGAPVRVPAQRLDSLLDSHLAPGQSIDFMSVDVEESGLAALKSNDWERFRPAILCIEENGITLSAWDASDSVRFMHDNGYRAYAIVPPNVFFTPEEFSG